MDIREHIKEKGRWEGRQEGRQEVALNMWIKKSRKAFTLPGTD